MLMLTEGGVGYSFEQGRHFQATNINEGEESMCLAVPMRITEASADGVARCRIGESESHVTISTALLEEPPAPGDYVIVHAGFALRRLDPADAEETLKLLREMLAAAPPGS
jgi:hydrogenase expression/formation protein HypC